MLPRPPSRRRLVQAAGAATLGFFGPWTAHHAWAQTKVKKPLLIGLATDDSGPYAASGQDEQRGMRMAIAEANERGGVLGRRIELVHADTAGDPAIATGVAEQMIRQQEVAFLLGGVHSGVASAMSKVAQAHGCIYFNTNSSSPTEAGKDCHRTKFVWDGNGTNFSISVVKGAMTGFGRDWVLITSDYTWGRNTAAGIRAIVEGNGGRIVEELMVAQNTPDFSATLAKVRDLNPGVIATAVGGDDLKALRRQVRENGLDRRFGWINNQQDWPDVYGLGREALFGIFGTTWYWGLGLSGVKEFVARYQQSQAGYRIKVPGNVFYNGYMATRELLRTIERTGSTHNLKLIKALETLRVPAAERMQHHDAYMNPQTHQLQQTIYMAAYNDRPREPDDLFRILGRLQPHEVEDRASTQQCTLESYAATPSYEP
ncbi:MAG TPA: ABC transporter substrate-binding protein [Rhizobacter sp.]|nr:ABC transporter substrate-binding protein [Rhizobacter sp.]